MSVKNLIINSIEGQYTAEYIANAFWNQRIAKVRKITLVPYIKKREIFSIAYIMVDEWCDSEMAYNFIQRLKNESKEARIVHHEEEWWAVELNTHNDGDIFVGPYTISFQSSYFETPIFLDVEEAVEEAVEEEQNQEDEEYNPDDWEEYNPDDWEPRVGFTKEWAEFHRRRPIKDINNIYYTVEEAEEQLWILSHKKDSTFEEAEALEFLRNELRIHNSVNNSNNVTLRNEDPNWSIVSWNSWN